MDIGETPNCLLEITGERTFHPFRTSRIPPENRCLHLGKAPGQQNNYAGGDTSLNFRLVGVFIAPKDNHHCSQNDPQIQIQ